MTSHDRQVLFMFVSRQDSGLRPVWMFSIVWMMEPALFVTLELYNKHLITGIFTILHVCNAITSAVQSPF